MKGREIVLLIFIILAGLLLTQTDKGHINWNWGVDWGEWEGPFFGGSHEFTAQETKTIDSPLPEELVVANSHGDVEVQPSADGTLTVFLETKAYRRSEEEAREAAQGVHLTVDRQGSKLILSTNRDTFRKKRFWTNWRIRLPEGRSIDIQNSYGLVKTEKTGRTSIINSHGAVTAQDVRGAFVCRTSYEDVNVSDLAADCQVECLHGAVTAVRVKGRVAVIASYGEVRVEEAGGDVVVNGTHTEVVARKVVGTVKAETTYRDISLAETGPATVIGHHSGVDARDIKGDLDVGDIYGRVTVHNIQGSLSVHGRSLEVMGRAISGPQLSISTSYQNIDLADFSGQTDITTSHGNVSLQPSRVGGDITVKAEHSEVRLVWPAGAVHPIEAQTRYGSIRWNLEAKPDLEKKNGFSLVKAFSQEQGRPRVALSTTYADIIVEPAGFSRAKDI